MIHRVRLASIGDCCADIYPDEKRIVLGGTAYNVAMAAKHAGADVSIVSAVGSDGVGRQFFNSFKKKYIDTSHLGIISGKTDSINIHLDQSGKPLFSDWKTNAIETVHLTDRNFLHAHDVVRCVLFTSTERLFREFCQLDLGQTLKVGDFAGASVDSVDIAEIERYASNLTILIKSVEDTSNTLLGILESIAQRHNCIVLSLLGSEGSTVFTKDKTYHQSAQKVQTKNTTGAGDTYQAYFLTTYIRTRDIQKAMAEATRAAAVFIAKKRQQLVQWDHAY